MYKIILEVLVKRGVKPHQIAKILDCSERTVQRILAGSNPRNGLAKKIEYEFKEIMVAVFPAIRG